MMSKEIRFEDQATVDQQSATSLLTKEYMSSVQYVHTVFMVMELI